MLGVEAHHHRWRYDVVGFDWRRGTLAPLHRHFAAEDLIKDVARADVGSAVAAQARPWIEEIEWLLTIAESAPLMHGVIHWLQRGSRFPALLERYRGRLPKGLRHVMQGDLTRGNGADV